MSSDQPENDLPGEWHGDLSLSPLKEASDFIKSTDSYTREKRHAAGCPVFRAHPGVRSTLITDHAGMEAVFRAPPEVLDREETPGFGALTMFTDELLEGVVPALVAHAGNHDPARALIDGAMALRMPAFEPACRAVLDGGWAALQGADGDEGDEANFQHAIYQTAAGVMFQWLFGIERGPVGAEHAAWVKQIFGLKADTWLASFFARKLKSGPAPEVVAWSRSWLEAIRECAPYPEFVEIGAAVGVSEREVAPQLMFAASFNGTAGAFATLYPALAHLSVDGTLRRALSNELEVFYKGTRSLDALDALPFLEAFFLESMRHYGRPRQYYRRAMKDLSIPTSEGESVPVKAGTRLCLVATVARQDTNVYGPTATVFDPVRFLNDPSLKAHVHPFGPPAGGGSPYGCAGAVNGTAPRLWKVLAASLGRDTRWRLHPEPRPNLDAFEGVEPAELTWSTS